MQSLSFSNSSKFFDALGTFCSDAIVSEEVSSKVASVLSDIKAHGDKAVLKYTKQFDGATLTAGAMRVRPADLKNAEKILSVADRRSIRQSISMVKS